jgi:hypothetical protein
LIIDFSVRFLVEEGAGGHAMVCQSLGIHWIRLIFLLNCFWEVAAQENLLGSVFSARVRSFLRKLFFGLPYCMSV